LGGDIGLNWADLYEVPEVLKARLREFNQVAGRRQVDAMPVVHPNEELPGWEAMPDEGPLIFRVKMSGEARAEGFSPCCDCVWFMRAGAVDVCDGHRIEAGEFFCASADGSYTLEAGPEGADWLVFSSGSSQP
jgi:hypothetical protein